eukprot:2617665-Prymnesium_polylepis.1
MPSAWKEQRTRADGLKTTPELVSLKRGISPAVRAPSLLFTRNAEKNGRDCKGCSSLSALKRIPSS